MNKKGMVIINNMHEFKNKIFNEDCFETFKRIPDKSINLIVIDPPYNINKADWDKFESIEDYIEFMGKVFKECERVLKDNGSFYFFHSDFVQIVELQNYINKNTRFEFKQFITWNKIHEKFKNYGYVQQRLSIDMMRNYYGGFTEYCLFYTKKLKEKSFDTGWEQVKNQHSFSEITDIIKKDINNSQVTYEDIYNHAFLDGRYKTKNSAKVNIRYKLGLSSGHRFDFIDEKLFNHMNKIIKFSFSYDWLKHKYESIKSELKAEINKLEGARYRFNTAIVKDDLRANSNVWIYPPATLNEHITPKPLDVIKNILKHSSNKGDIVLDCFMGSGTTAIACLETGRNYIGCEVDQDYYTVIEKRIHTYLEEKDKNIF